MNDGLDVAVNRSGGLIEVAATGEIDIATVEAFRQALQKAIFETQRVVSVNLLEITFIGSVGINSLVEARQLAIRHGKSFRVNKASRKVERVLELMGMSDYFD